MPRSEAPIAWVDALLDHIEDVLKPRIKELTKRCDDLRAENRWLLHELDKTEARDGLE